MSRSSEVKDLLRDLRYMIWQSQAVHGAIVGLTPTWSSRLPGSLSEVDRTITLMLINLNGVSESLEKRMDSTFSRLDVILREMRDEENGNVVCPTT